jgi:hypothetical protein
VALQKVDSDLFKATRSIEVVRGTLEGKRREAEISFADIWEKSTQLALEAETVLQTPRLSKRQQHRVNVPADSPEEYFRRALYIPFLDNLLSQLEERFSSHASVIYRFQALIPSFTSLYHYRDIEPVVNTYNAFVDEDSVDGEFQLWQELWRKKNEAERPTTALDALVSCDPLFYPNIHILLRIAATIPVTTAAAERTFSTMKRLKSYLRTTMGPERLSTHKETPIDVDDVIDRFSSHNRRIDFVL